MVGVVGDGHYNCSRSRWEVLELGDSFGVGILSPESLNTNLSLCFHAALPWEARSPLEGHQSFGALVL